MPSVVNPEAGDVFTLTIRKQLTANPAIQWVNHYEFLMGLLGAELGTAMLNQVREDVVTFEKGIHYNAVQFVSARWSTWEADSDPYNMESFISTPLVGTGSLAPSTDMLGLGVGLFCNRAVLAGRPGRVLYRGALQEGEVSAPAGTFILSNPSNVATRVQDAEDNAGMVSYYSHAISVTDDLGMALVMAHAHPTTGAPVLRSVHDIIPVGVQVRTTNNRWFNHG